MKQYLLYVLFVLAIGSMVALVVNVFGEEQEEIRLAAAVETDLEDLPETFAVLSETFDEPIADSDVARIKKLASNPALDEMNQHALGTIEVIFEGRPTTLTLETDIYREDGTYLYLYLFADPDVVEALDERIMAYYEELGI
ncbi:MULTISPECIES: hypothetical protein [Exiguobacterium]|uniref:hypothetical protein n=1 Tax=Exiguobacterium TaxID=33986 RepID=UPI001BE9FB4E|nr:MULTISPECIES: hypothetical protein [Exiguobacterium]MCT4778156.1 hypothetical protein [Exiguobacterium aquaticum]MCT4790184.1 hypothetical protein [Exiguobacterium mexicanum]